MAYPRKISGKEIADLPADTWLVTNQGGVLAWSPELWRRGATRDEDIYIITSNGDRLDDVETGAWNEHLDAWIIGPELAGAIFMARQHVELEYWREFVARKLGVKP